MIEFLKESLLDIFSNHIGYAFDDLYDKLQNLSLELNPKIKSEFNTLIKELWLLSLKETQLEKDVEIIINKIVNIYNKSKKLG